MNKRFFTLIAAVAMVFSAFTMHAQTLSSIAETGDRYVLLVRGSGANFLTWARNGTADSVVIGTLPGGLANDSSLWKIEKGTAEGTFKFINKATKQTLKIAEGATTTKISTATTKVVEEWAVKDDKIFAYYGGSIATEAKLMALGSVSGTIVTDMDLAGPFKVSSYAPSVGLKAKELGDGIDLFFMELDGDYEGDIFKGIQLKATDIPDADVGNSDWVYLQDAAHLNSTEGNKKPLYFGLDTTKWGITNSVGVQGAKFKLDTTYAKGDNGASVGNADYQKFQFVRDLTTDKIHLRVYRAPMFEDGIDGKVSGTPDVGPVTMAFEKITGSTTTTVLSVENNGVTTIDNMVHLTLSLGTPGKLAGGPGVYMLQDTEGNYIYAGYKYNEAYSSDHYADSLLAVAKAPVWYDAAGQWYVKEVEGKDGEYYIADRDHCYSIPNGDAKVNRHVVSTKLYKTADENTFIVCGVTYKFTKMDGVEAGGGVKKLRVLATKYLDEEELALNIYSLDVNSEIPGMPSLSSYKDGNGNLAISAEGDVEEEYFKARQKVFQVTAVDAMKNKGRGATLLGDFLGIAFIQLYPKGSETDNVYLKDQKFQVGKADATNFVFLTEGVDKAGNLIYSLYADYAATDYKPSLDSIVLVNIDNGELYQTADGDNIQKNYFDLKEKAAPDYEDFGLKAGEGVHKTLQLATNDGDKAITRDMISKMAVLKNLAGLKADQPDYEKNQFGLWLKRVGEKEMARPNFYVTTQNDLTASQIAADSMYFLVNPYSNVYQETDKKVTLKADSKYWWGEGKAIRAAFMAGKAEVDTLSLEGATYKELAKNPAVVAFAKKEVTGGGEYLLMENRLPAYKNDNYEKGTDLNGNVADPQPTTPENYYLKQVNEILVWTKDEKMALIFDVKAPIGVPTGNEGAEVSEFAVVGGNGIVTIQGGNGKQVVISNLLGQILVNTTLSSDEAVYTVPAGVVVVSVQGEEAVKALVK